MPDFWASTGYKLLHKQGDALTVSDDFLRSLFLRPEVAPVAESCDAELRLHDALMATPRRAVAGGAPYVGPWRSSPVCATTDQAAGAATRIRRAARPRGR